MGRFTTGTLPPPLNIDLLELEVSGADPTEAEGTTRDGFDLVGWYGSGVMSITVSNRRGVSALEDGTEILRAEIGPETELTRAQFCRAAGLTVNGTYPEETSTWAHRTADLTGATTYWKLETAVTDPISRRIVSALQDIFPNALLVQPVFEGSWRSVGLAETAPDRIGGCQTVVLVDGASDISEIRHDAEDIVAKAPGQVQIRMHYYPWSGRKSGSDTHTFRAATEFPTNDTEKRRLLEQLDERLGSILSPD
ncbi:hypothetical protein HKCCE2091_15975 [Rhodobacterales bacterium HKCCE2091]|nr:hypothetical protein [Rhodobacterales bacterium HKCCE2091]